MLLRIPQVLTAPEVRQAREILDAAPWGDGRVTSGEQSAQAKNNRQLPGNSAEAQKLRALVLQGLQRSATFFSATLPKHISPPMFNAYGGDANTFGDHVDSAIWYLQEGGARVRTDISCTLFFSEPGEYDGGELVTDDLSGGHRIKLNAGDLVVYPGTSVHRVEPVTRGRRLASFFWVQSMVRSDEQRRLLYGMDNHLRGLRTSFGESDADIVGLTGTYHNLLRQWADV